jgi:hypothetical protein
MVSVRFLTVGEGTTGEQERNPRVNTVELDYKQRHQYKLRLSWAGRVAQVKE